MRDEDIKDFAEFLAEFQGETDRGAALVGAALIDKKLADTLRAFMLTGSVADGLLDGADAPLGGFSARIKAAFALGLITRHEMDECHLIRKVRNEFAHRVHGTTFKDARISGMCDGLKSDLPGGRAAFAGNPRGVFINAVIMIVLQLTYRDQWVARERSRERTKEDVLREFAGTGRSPPRPA